MEYGQVSFKNRALGMEHWVDEVLPEAIRAVHEHSGGRGVHLVGWSLGGIFALLVAADRPDLPIASLTVRRLPRRRDEGAAHGTGASAAQPRPGHAASITRAYRALGGIPTPLVNWAFTAASAQKVVTKPLAVLTHLDDTDYLAQMEAVDRFMSSMTAYPGRTFGQLYHRFVKGNALAAGQMEIGDRTIDLAAISVPVLVFAGNTDGIAPLPAVRAVVPLLGRVAEVRFEVVPGGHLGMLTGRAARGTTWQVIDEWVAEWSRRTCRADDGTATKKAPAKKAPAKKTAAKKAPAKKALPRGPRRRPHRSTRSAPTPRAATARPARARWARGDDAPRRAGDDLPRGVRIGYGSGSVATGAFGTVPGLMLLPYLTDELGIAALWAGVIVFLPKAWDVVLNPVAGRVSDRTVDPAGPRRPWLIRAGLMLAGAFALIFAAPDLGSRWLEAGWVLVFFVLAASAYAFFQVPYVAMPAEITTSYDERTRLMTWRVAILAFTIMLAGATAPVIRDAVGGRDGYRVMGVVMAVLIASAS